MKHLLAIIFSGLLISASGQSEPENKTNSQLQSVLNQYKDSVTDYGIIALSDNRGTITKGAIGIAAPNEQLTPEHLMCIGSITKTYTATCIFILQDMGKLNIDSPIKTYISTGNQFIDPEITIRQLLNHSSGINDFGTATVMNEALSHPERVYTADYCLSKIDTADFKKGTKHSYSNSNYFLLGLIIEQVTQQPLETAIQDLLLKPWGLNNTYPYLSPSIPGIAHPMMSGKDFFKEWYIKPVNDLSRGDGNIVTTAEDLHRFYKLLLVEKKILKPAFYKQMMDFQRIEGKKTSYGCGIFEKNIDSKTFHYHTGRQLSYIANCIYSPTDNTILIVLTNNMNDTYTDMMVNELTGVAFY